MRRITLAVVLATTLIGLPGPASAAGFTDVDPASTHGPAIARAVELGLAAGTTAHTFDPAGAVRRDQLASFLSRLLGAVSSGHQHGASAGQFSDVAGNVHAEAIASLAAHGIVRGTTPTTFSPAEAVTRAQVASFLVRLHETATGTPLPTVPGPFRDVGGSVHAGAIASAAAAGIVRGTSMTTFDPDLTVSRAQMASMLVRHHDLLTRAPAPQAPPDGDLWSDPATWEGAVPTTGQVVTVPAGQTIALDVSPPPLRGLRVDGTLVLGNADLTLQTGWIMVHGRLQAGAPGAPHRHRAEIVLDGPLTDDIHGMGARVLGVMGHGVLDLHGAAPATPWTVLADTAAAGSEQLTVRSAAGWAPGDQVVVASTDLDPARAEERTVTAVHGTTVLLDEPLAHTHWGRTDSIAGRDVEQRAEVGVLNRGIVVRGPADAPATLLGGHIMAMDGAQMRLSGVELRHMGQAGLIGRYPVHYHLQGDVHGSWVQSSVVRHSFNRCMTIHGTNGVTLADNVGYDALGHCYFFEDGTETGNTLERNLGLVTRKPAESHQLLPSDRAPSTFWVSNPSNTLRGNHAGGAEGNGFWYDLARDTGAREAPMGSFDGNVAHSNRAPGVFRSGSGLLVEHYRPPGPAAFTGFSGWKNSGFGVWAERGVEVFGAVLSDNYVGFLGRFSTLRDSHVVGHTSNTGEKHWSMTGIGLYDDRATVRDVTLANFKRDEWRHQVGIGGIVLESTSLVELARIRFVNADRVRLAPPWITEEPVAVALRDLDGSVLGTGTPSTVISDHPLLRTSACSGQVCPLDAATTMVRLQDQTGARSALGPTTVIRDDGAASLAHDPSWADRPQSQTAVAMGRAYRFTPARPAPNNLEWIVANDQHGWVELGILWPHATVHVYDGWGEWARRLTPATQRSELAGGGRYWLDPVTQTLWIRVQGNGEPIWHRHKLCTAAHCGDGTGSRRS